MFGENRDSRQHAAGNVNGPLPGTGLPSPQPAVLLLPVRMGLLAAVFLYCCFPALDLLVRSWSLQDEYGFRFLVPFMAALWVWHDWPQLRRLTIEPALREGSALLAGAGLVLLLGRLTPSALTQELALFLVLAALLLLLAGRRFLKRLVLPLAFLALMTPVLDPLIARIHWPFQQFTAASAAELLSFLGVPVHRTAQFLELPRATLEVAAASSGVRYLVSTLFLSVPLLIITQRTSQRRLLLFLLALVISIAANPVRVTLIGLWAHYSGAGMQGPPQLLDGYAVYLAGLAVLFGCAWLLQRNSGPPAGQAACEPDTLHSGGLREFHPFNRAWFRAFSILLGTGLALHVYAIRPVPLEQGLDGLPARLSGWRISESGQQDPILPGKQHVFRCQSRSGREVALTIAYLESQDEERKLVTPLLHQSVDPGSPVFLTGPDSGVVRVNKAVIAEQGREEVRLFWYQVNGRTLAEGSDVKWANALDGALRRRNNGALVLLSCTTLPEEQEQAMRDLTDLAGKLLQVLDEYIP